MRCDHEMRPAPPLPGWPVHVHGEPGSGALRPGTYRLPGLTAHHQVALDFVTTGQAGERGALAHPGHCPGLGAGLSLGRRCHREPAVHGPAPPRPRGHAAGFASSVVHGDNRFSLRGDDVHAGLARVPSTPSAPRVFPGTRTRRKGLTLCLRALGAAGPPHSPSGASCGLELPGDIRETERWSPPVLKHTTLLPEHSVSPAPHHVPLL